MSTTPSSRRRGMGLVLAAALAGLAAWPAVAQTDKPLRIVVPFGPGGSDTLARAMAEKLSVQLKQPVIVENKPGAAALIGSEYVAACKRPASIPRCGATPT